MTPESAAADIVDRLSDLAADSRENAQMVIQNLLRELVEQNRVPQYDLELRDCHEQIARLKRELKAATYRARTGWRVAMTHNAGTQRPGSPDGSLATETQWPGSLK